MSKPHIYLGNLNYSSWSMRPWLVLKRAGIDFEDTVIPLLTEEFKEKIVKLSSTGLVPVLHLGGVKITDSLAISEWAAEQDPSVWPADPLRRAAARAATAQMHAGFLNIRNELPVNLKRSAPRTDLPHAAKTEIVQMKSLWKDCLETSGGPFLFGDWSIADAFFTPVATRFRSYHIPMDETEKAYCDHLLQQAEFKEWEARALQETYEIPAFEGDTPQPTGWLSKG